MSADNNLLPNKNRDVISSDNNANKTNSHEVTNIINPTSNFLCKGWDANSQHRSSLLSSSKSEVSHTVDPELQIISETKLKCNTVRKPGNTSTHRPLFQAAAAKTAGSSTQRKQGSSKFIKKLPNFVRPSASQKQQLSRENFVNFKRNCYSLSPEEVSHGLSGSSSKESHNSHPMNVVHLNNSSHPDNLSREPNNDPPQNNNTSLSSPAIPPSHLSPTSMNQLDIDIAKEIGTVLESLARSNTSTLEGTDNHLKRLKNEGNRALSMVGMVAVEGPTAREEATAAEVSASAEVSGDRKLSEDGEVARADEDNAGACQVGKRKKVRHTRLNSRLLNYLIFNIHNN